MLQYVLLSFIIGVIVYDIYVLATRGYAATASWMIFQAAKNYPIVPFLFGVLMGHCLWPNSP